MYGTLVPQLPDMPYLLLRPVTLSLFQEIKKCTNLYDILLLKNGNLFSHYKDGKLHRLMDTTMQSWLLAHGSDSALGCGQENTTLGSVRVTTVFQDFI